jgi:uncharacterized protein YbaP (TraB family)
MSALGALARRSKAAQVWWISAAPAPKRRPGVGAGPTDLPRRPCYDPVMRHRDRRSLLPLLALVVLPACAAAPAPVPAAPASSSTSATDSSAAASTAAAPVEVRGPFLWRVEGKAGPSYLFGTIHAGVRSDREVPEIVWRTLAESDSFTMEADITGAGPAELMKLAALPKGESLDRMLGKKDWARLLKMIGKGVPAKSLKPLAPWMVYSLVIQMLYPTPQPLDLALQDRARSLGKEMHYLEDWKFQVEVLAETMGVDDLRELLDDSSKVRDQFESMIAAYRSGDFERLSAIALDPESLAAHPERMKRMFDDRNRVWVDALVPRLAAGRAFVAVGVGHFAGPVGLVELLRGRGLEVQRVPAAAAAAPTTVPPPDQAAAPPDAAAP